MDNVFEKRLKELGISRQVTAATIVANAQKVIDKEFGQRGNDNLRVISFSKGVLKIATTNGAWAAECRKIEKDLKVGQVSRVYYFVAAEFTD